MDRILTVGFREPKFIQFLKKLGHDVTPVETLQAAEGFIGSHLIDLVILGTLDGLQGSDVFDFLRTQESTRDAAIVAFGHDPDESSLLRRTAADRGDTKIEIVEQGTPLGSIAGKIATLLRLRKMGGADIGALSLAELNAQLRDYNSRYQRELDEARQIQANLLPSTLPSGPTFDIAAVYRPLEEVGGDWYNVQMEKTGSISFQVADVTGHGLSAAFLSCMAKLAFFAADEPDPGKLLKEMNRLLAPQLPAGRFITMGAFLYDTSAATVSYARGGHPPGLILRANGETLELKGDGFAIGFFDDSDYGTHKESLGIGDILVTYTDGLIEAQNRDRKVFGIEGLIESMKNNSGTPSSSTIIEGILKSFESFLDGRILKDDVTIILLKRTA